MIPEPVVKAFGLDNHRHIQTINSGLINNSYKIWDEKGDAYFLQKLNVDVFKCPYDIQHNYTCIREHLRLKNSFSLPPIIPEVAGTPLYISNGGTWRCFEFVPNTYSKSTAESSTKAYEVANCFGKFTAGLTDLDPSDIKTILPDFHNPDFRFRQFQAALKHADAQQKKEAAFLIDAVLNRTYLIDWYKNIEKKPGQYPRHILHHDSKISNILFEEETNDLLFPIDLDTTQPGFFFSDLGDMIRSMVPNYDENFINYNELELRTHFYEAIIQGYLDAMGDYLSESEKKDMTLAGPIVIYMQALRFLTDFLNNNIYYRVEYSAQNKDRALNQIRLLELLENYLQLKY